MVYFRRGGKGAVSRDIGRRCMFEITTHDDGVYHMGGRLALGVGPLGSGKTTLALQVAMGCCHTRGNVKNDTSNARKEPETIIYRGRQYDYWPLFLPNNLSRSYPGYYRDVAIHIHEQDTKIKFQTHVRGSEYLDFEKHGVSIIPYHNCEDLYENLITGGINIVYEPSHYSLPTELAERIRIRQFKADASDDVPREILKLHEEGKTQKELAELYGVSQKTISRKLRQLRESVPAPTSVWWFELMETIIRVKEREEFFTVIMDEAHQVFPADCRGEHWHLIFWFANTCIDLRRMNVSLIAFTHDVKLVDYRIVDRMHFFLWLPGATPYRSMIASRSLIPSLEKGEVIVERKGVEFGMADYEKIKDQPPVVKVEGLPTFT